MNKVSDFNLLRVLESRVGLDVSQSHVDLEMAVWRMIDNRGRVAQIPNSLAVRREVNLYSKPAAARRDLRRIHRATNECRLFVI